LDRVVEQFTFVLARCYWASEELTWIQHNLQITALWGYSVSSYDTSKIAQSHDVKRSQKTM